MPHGIPWKEALATLPRDIEESAADWHQCAIGERFAFDLGTRTAIMCAWGRFVGKSAMEIDEVSRLIRKAEDPASEAMRIAEGDRIRALALLGGTFPDAVSAAVEDFDGNEDREDALRILKAIDTLANDLPPTPEVA